MKKVGIVTFQFADNYGAVMQCYALQKFLNNFSGVDAKVLNRMRPSTLYHRIWTNVYDKRRWEKKRAKFDRFLIEKCNLDEKRISIIDGSGYDILCVGSDQIWNPLWDCKEYLLPHVSQGIKKISYAASIGCSVERAASYTDLYKKYLPSFSYLSVREKEHVHFVSELSKKECECVLDPTLLLDEEEYMDIVRMSKKGEGENYILFYWLDYNQDLYKIVPIVNKISSERGLKVKHTLWKDNADILFPNSECVYYDGIEDFLSLLNHASFIVTNSYHGTIFSIKFEVPFYTYIDESMKSRFTTLLSYSNFEDRIITGSKSTWNDRVDFRLLKDELDRKKTESIDYLKKAIEV